MVTRHTTIDYAVFVSDPQYFWGKVVCVDSATETCWHWLGLKYPNGYGMVPSRRRRFLAHRVAWVLTYGTIDHTLTLDHLCRNRACVNPAHLEQVSMHMNNLRGNGFSGKNARKTHCPQGHPYDESNTILTTNPRPGLIMGRKCRLCNRARKRTPRALEQARSRGRSNRLRDRALKNRFPGNLNGLSKLTEEKVRKIRQMHSSKQWTYKQIAAFFGLAKSTIARVLARQVWQHVADC